MFVRKGIPGDLYLWGMKQLGILLLNYIRHRAQMLEEPGALYGISWEEQETRELACFVKRATLELERRRWTCPRCGAPVVVHTGVCSGCKTTIDKLGA